MGCIRLGVLRRWAVKMILVADDQALTRDVVRVVLSTNPAYQVQEAENGAQALALAQAQHPDLVLLDVQMPEMTGPEVCLRLKGSPETWNIPILLMSGMDPEDVEGYALLASADGFFA